MLVADRAGFQEGEELSKYDSAQEYFDSISREISSEQAEKLAGTFQFDIEDAGQWMVQFTEDGRINQLEPGGEVEPDCTMMAKEKDWLKIVSGETKPMSAFMTGKLKVKGSTGKAMKLQQIIGQ